ncbi:hypothetical protein DRP77_10630 [Candidatus Poribacteria bacterium]|nr:MAG: hypothetical protein DRP77_10630 [Candidatus Poribacteria bacterium]
MSWRENGGIPPELGELFDELRSVQPPPELRERILSATVHRRRKLIRLGLIAAFAAFIGIGASLLTLNPFRERRLSEREARMLIEALSQPVEIIEGGSTMFIESIISSLETSEGGVRI